MPLVSPTPGLRIYRSPWSLAVSVAWAVIGVAILGDALLRDSSGSPWPGVLIVVAISGVVWSLFARPAVIASAELVLLRNVVRDVGVPWGRLTYIDAPLTLTVHDDDDRSWRSWAISASNRPRRSITASRPMYGTDQASGANRELRADAVVRELTSMRDVAPTWSDGSGEVSKRVAWAGLGPLLLAVGCGLAVVLG